jgi:large subunit ribosomal protein L4
MSSIAVTVKDAAGKGLDERSIDTRYLDDRVRHRLIKEALVMHEANRRSGTHKVKTRGEVAGSNKKPWRQKGTGRARAGTRKSPLWRGGGVIFGPRPRDYSYALNKKQRRLALRSAMFSKFRDGEVVVLEGVELSEPSTKALAKALRSCGITGSCLLVTLAREPVLVLSGRNIPTLQVAPLKDLNAFDVLRARTVVLLPDAFEALAGDASPLGPPREEEQEGGDERGRPAANVAERDATGTDERE